MATKARLPAEILLRKGWLATVVEARDRFIGEAVLEQGYLASQVAEFLGCHPSNVSRALAEELIELSKSVTMVVSTGYVDLELGGLLFNFLPINHLSSRSHRHTKDSACRTFHLINFS